MNNLRKLRNDHGMKQAELAASIGVAQSTLSGWETGKYEIDEQSLLKLTRMFDVSAGYILGIEPPRRSDLNYNDKKDVAKSMEQLREQLLNEEGLMFDGEPLSPEAIESILNAMQLGLEAAKQRNKEKYTPKKYKKE